MSRKPEKPKSKGVQLLALSLGLGPIYGFAIWTHISIGRSYSVQEMITYPLVFGGATIAWILLLLRLLCRERVKDLNLESGSIKRDLVHGLILFAVFFAFKFVNQVVLTSSVIKSETVVGIIGP